MFAMVEVVRCTRAGHLLIGDLRTGSPGKCWRDLNFRALPLGLFLGTRCLILCPSACANASDLETAFSSVRMVEKPPGSISLRVWLFVLCVLRLFGATLARVDM